MIGIQKNIVMDFNGRCNGELLNPYFQGGSLGNTPDFKNRMLCKIIEVYDNFSTPSGIAKILAFKDTAGKTIEPTVETGVRVNTQINSNEPRAKTWEVILRHRDSFDVVDLLLKDPWSEDTLSVCQWINDEFTNYGEWEQKIHQLYLVKQSSSDLTFKIGAVLKTDQSTGWATYRNLDITIHWDEESSGTTRQMTISVGTSELAGSTPVTALDWRNLYTAIVNKYPVDENNYFLTVNSDYVELPAYDMEINDAINVVNSEISVLNDKVDQVSLTANSKFVSR